MRSSYSLRRLPVVFALSAGFSVLLLSFYQTLLWNRDKKLDAGSNYPPREAGEREALGQIPTQDMNKPVQYQTFTGEQANLHLWIDVPFILTQRRRCITFWDGEQTGHVNLELCKTQEGEATNQMWHLSRQTGDKASSFTKFQLKVANQTCASPEPTEGLLLITLNNCADVFGYWRWRIDMRLEYTVDGEVVGCISSKNAPNNLVLEGCNSYLEGQVVEAARLAEGLLWPLQPHAWAWRQHAIRQAELAAAKIGVDRELREIAILEEHGVFQHLYGQRRAAVFYVDTEKQFLSSLSWWIFTWEAIKLNSAEAAFDLIVFVHPESVQWLPGNCAEVPEDWDPLQPGPGRCLYKQLEGLHHRDYKYDFYTSSLECLVHPGSKFLEGYRMLMRTDLDTFPTPLLVDFWPSDIVCNRDAGTDFWRNDIRTAVKAAAAAAGIKHHGWHNPDSTWFGPTQRILALTRLTLQLYRFVRAHMFGPGTMCSCATCVSSPPNCQWGKGPYPGVLLLYSQEIAMNRLWTEREAKSQPQYILDAPSIYPHFGICHVAHIHVRHTQDPFSKFVFNEGGYANYSLANLDITNTRDYAMFMAIVSAGQGEGAQEAMNAYYERVDGTPLEQLCAHAANLTHMQRYQPPGHYLRH